MICARCDQPIRDYEGRREYTPDSGSSAKPTVVVHTRRCRLAPRGTVQIPK